MGLDMYLSVRRYLRTTDENYPKVIDALGLGYDYDRQYSAFVEGTIAYWRKANAIHSWFVENIQDGDDNCGSFSVPATELYTLRAICRRSVDNYDCGHPNPVELKTQEGFFFGSTEYDEDYWEILRDTVTLLDRALGVDNADEVEYMYHASW